VGWYLTPNCSGAIIPPFTACVQGQGQTICARERLGQHGEEKRKRQNADIAQLVEQVIRNDQVVGSNPTIGSSQIPSARAELGDFGVWRPPESLDPYDEVRHSEHLATWMSSAGFSGAYHRGSLTK
jgi:hypothetical protein